MENKRYAIVKVECPIKKEIDPQFVCFPGDNSCSGCRYGDTKQQLIKKIAQALFNSAVTEHLKNTICETELKNIYRGYLKQAKFVVEFLGVEE